MGVYMAVTRTPALRGESPRLAVSAADRAKAAYVYTRSRP